MLELATAMLWSKLQVSSPSRKILENYTYSSTYVPIVYLASLFLLFSSCDIWHSGFFNISFADLVDIADTCTHSSCVDIKLNRVWNLHGAVEKLPEFMNLVSDHWQLYESPAFACVVQVPAHSLYVSFRGPLLLRYLDVGWITHY